MTATYYDSTYGNFQTSLYEEIRREAFGVDIHEKAISAARSLASQRGLESRTDFRVVDADKQLPFAEASFDAITCIDAITHLPDRPRLLTDWARLLRRGGRLLFTNSAVVTGPLTSAEVAVRSLSGFLLFVPRGYDERIIAQCG